MPGTITLDELKADVERGSIDTVIAAIVDMQGRLMGKRFHAQHFIDSAWEETHCCNYLLATDLEMATPDGYASSSWSRGYGDYIMHPDLTTLRRLPWLEGTAFVLCDVLDHHTHSEVNHSPRAMLKKQIAQLEGSGFSAASATELEFFIFKESFELAREKNYQKLTPFSPYNEDYHIFQTSKEEPFMRLVRNHLVGAGIPVENTKGEAAAGQLELNIRYANALDMSDDHTLAKNAVKEIVFAAGHSVTFMAKYNAGESGSSSHIHLSLWKKDDDGNFAPAFYDADAPQGMSQIMQQFLAGLLTHAAEITYFLAPYVNSYKRFIEGTFAPTRILWSIDNRTAGFRIVGENTPQVRVECRIGGGDINPYLALSALLAAGASGIKQKLSLDEMFVGDAYAAQSAQTIPGTLRDAADAMSESSMLRAAFGDDVVEHYTRAALWEIDDFNRAVTDYEIKRGFERS